MKSKKIVNSRAVAVLLVLPALSACTHTELAQPQPEFGNSVSQNMAAQIVNPDGPTGEEELTMQGARATVGQGRYSSDNVEQPTDLSTVRGVAGAGGGGGAN